MNIDYEMALKLQAELNRQEERANRHNASEEATSTSRQAAKRQDDQDEDIRWVYPKPSTKPNPPKAPVRRQAIDSPSKALVPVRGIQAQYNDYLNQTQNLVHPEWELIDPTPDVFAMFFRFDQKFFQKRLGAVCLEWSKRMTSCAGICYQRSNRVFKEVTIRLSEPLLKLRPRKDLVETLLHEMIHAYCFVLNIREGNGGHGPNFKRMMNLINQTAGTNITVYHSFHDEVALYRNHVWRCTGICQNHAPFQGWVRRSTNRAPGPYDQWWEKHLRECGGTFQKVSGPEPEKKPTKAKIKTKKEVKPVPGKSGLDGWLGKKAVKPPVPSIPSGLSNNPGSAATAMIQGLAGSVPPTSYPGPSTDPFAGVGGGGSKPSSGGLKRGSNIMSFGDLSRGSDSEKEESRNNAAAAMTGVGYQMGGSSTIDITGGEPNEASTPHLRERWLRRVEQNRRLHNHSSDSNSSTGSNSGAPEAPPSKRRRPNANDIINWESYDDDIQIGQVNSQVINVLDSSDEEGEVHGASTASPKKLSSQERMALIKREVLLDESQQFSEDDITFIDNEFDENLDKAHNASLDAAVELADQSIIDDFFGEDTLLRDFQDQNDVRAFGSGNSENDTTQEIVFCPICFERIQRNQLDNHLEGCSITISVEPPSFKPKSFAGGSKGKKSSTANGASTSFASTPSRASNASNASTRRSSSGQMTRKKLQEYGYTAEEIAVLELSGDEAGSSFSDSVAVNDSEDELTPRQRRQRGLFKATVQCPRCGGEYLGHQLEAHRAICQGKQRR
ncbi:uncharacterized protein LOC6504920 isoform X2 [Drosophila ananassae]|uniref:uncharacterized protein LOC6504920 isoform X2 n=1 Tax=Drosophila ananassae TaxID=7217 RepID=UPI0013A5CDF7|nr:uncharacterized protein LOC6504920 isoform X2 [Drosophila ananassae]